MLNVYQLFLFSDTSLLFPNSKDSKFMYNIMSFHVPLIKNNQNMPLMSRAVKLLILIYLGFFTFVTMISVCPYLVRHLQRQQCSACGSSITKAFFSFPFMSLSKFSFLHLLLFCIFLISRCLTQVISLFSLPLSLTVLITS